jgi:hypothetical protein
VFSDSVVWYHLLLPLSNAFFWHRILELYSKATSYYANIMGKCCWKTAVENCIRKWCP